MISIAVAGGGLTFELGDVCTMTYQSRFDAVVSFNALHWVLDQRVALSRIAAALRPSGWALLVFVCAGERPSLESVAMKVVRRTAWQPYFQGFVAPFVHPDLGVWTDTAESCGLRMTDATIDDLRGISSLGTGSCGGPRSGLEPGPTACRWACVVPLSAMSSTRTRRQWGRRVSSDSFSSEPS
jgi:SAM-dependent methyltransferase